VDVSRLAGEAVADVLEVLLHVLPHPTGDLHHHGLHLGRVGRGGGALRLRPGDGRGHNLLAHQTRGAQGAFDEAALGLIVVIGRGAEPRLEGVAVLAGEGVADHGPANSRSC
jgi:hypothetical protein